MAQAHGMGHSVKRKEDPRFIRGRGTYIGDVKVPGMLYLDIGRSPYAHATIKAIHPEKALAISGVVAVIPGKDLDKSGVALRPTLISAQQMGLPTDPVLYEAQQG